MLLKISHSFWATTPNHKHKPVTLDLFLSSGAQAVGSDFGPLFLRKWADFLGMCQLQPNLKPMVTHKQQVF